MGSHVELIGILQAGLAAASLRHGALAHNIANVNTPGYQALQVTFESRLAAAVDQGDGALAITRSHPGHLSGRSGPSPEAVHPAIQLDRNSAQRADGNNVDVEGEMARLAANQVWYGALTRQVQDHLQRLRLAITEGRR